MREGRGERGGVEATGTREAGDTKEARDAKDGKESRGGKGNKGSKGDKGCKGDNGMQWIRRRSRRCKGCWGRECREKRMQGNARPEIGTKHSRRPRVLCVT
jgi:hypothetical protein